MSTPMLEMNGIRKLYGRGKKRVEALKGISLAVRAGEAVGFIGRNGAGKSSSIRILTGLSRPDEGEAMLFGLPVANPEARRQLGYCPENPYLLDALTPLEWLAISAANKGYRGKSADEESLHWLQRFGVADVARKPIRTFSKGMTQRVALANAMVGSPKLLILDEPLSGLDPIGRRDAIENLNRYVREGGTLFFSSHVLSDVETLASRFVLIDKGALHDFGEKASPAMRRAKSLLIRWQGSATSTFVDQVADTPEHWHCRIPIENVTAILAEISQSGGTLLSINSEHLRLEDMFISRVEGAARSKEEP